MAVRPIKISVVADAARARKELSSFGSTLKRTLGTGLALAGGVGVVQTFQDIVSSASEAQQSLGATESVFGKYADTVVRRSKEAADSVGLSANAYRESSNLLGALFKNQGVELDKLSGKTNKHLTLAADLSAMYGGPVTDAVDALTAAYKGEFNQLEKYGVSLKQDTINTEANQVAKGKYGKELKALTSKQQALAKQLATQQLLFKQSGDAAGTFGKEANTLAGQQQRLNAELENAKAEIGTALLPLLTDLAKWTRDEVVPALEDFAEWMGKNSDEITATGREIGSNLLPVLETFGDVLGVVVDVVKSIPEPMRGFVLQAAAAALVLPKLNAAVTAASTSGGGLITNLRNAEKRTEALATAARTAAGILGLLALVDSGDRANESLQALEQAAGAAALGFSAGGPWGAVAGVVISAGKSLWDTERAMSATRDRARELNEEIRGGVAKRLKEEADTYLDWALTLNNAGNVTLDTIRKIKAEINATGPKANLATSLSAEMETLGLTSQTTSKAMTGNVAALREVATAMAEASGGSVTYEQALKALKTNSELSVDAYAKINPHVLSFAQGWAKTRGQLSAVQQDLAGMNRQTKSLREAVREPIRTLFRTNAPDTTTEIAKVAKQYKLTPAEIKTVIRLSGVDTSYDHIKALIRQMSGIAPEAKKGGKKTGKDLNEGVKSGVNSSLDLWRAPLKANVGDGGGAKPKAHSGGVGVGLNLAAGTARGIYSGMPWVTTAATLMALRAKWAAETTLGIRSPSRVFAKIGRQAVDGFTLGVRSQATRGSQGVAEALERITAKVRKSITGKNQGAREKALLKRLSERYRLLRANGSAQDRLNTRLETARERVKELTEEYAAYAKTVRDSITATGNVTQLGRQDDGTVSITSLLNELRNKAAAAQRFSSLLRDLAGKGLSQTAVQQMLDAGPEAALATAEAIASGGAAAIMEINALHKSLAATGDQLGGSMADRYYGAGVRAAEGLVAGLEAQAAQLDAAAVRMASALVAAVKKALGIRSPSRVFAGIGDQVVRGLDIGIDDTHVKRTGATAAAALQKGFGTPALDAYAKAGAEGPGRRVITLKLTAEQVDRMRRGEEIQADLDYARSNGLRGVTF